MAKLGNLTFQRQKQLGLIPADTLPTQRPESIPVWDSLSSDQKKLYVRMMEACATALAHSDAQLGRILESFIQSGQQEMPWLFLDSE